nr:hypothetical protein [Tanacetum cinerariifolium]
FVYDALEAWMIGLLTSLISLIKCSIGRSRRHILLGLPVNDFKKVLVGQFLIDKVKGGY